MVAFTPHSAPCPEADPSRGALGWPWSRRKYPPRRHVRGFAGPAPGYQAASSPSSLPGPHLPREQFTDLLLPDSFRYFSSPAQSRVQAQRLARVGPHVDLVPLKKAASACSPPSRHTPAGPCLSFPGGVFLWFFSATEIFLLVTDMVPIPHSPFYISVTRFGV